MKKPDQNNLLAISLAMIALSVSTLPFYLKVFFKYFKYDESDKLSLIQHLDVEFMNSLLFLLFPTLHVIFLVFGVLIFREYYRLRAARKG